jgi:hypothetical protein
MAKISLTFETSAAQDKALTWLLTRTNADAVHLDMPLPDVSALLAEMLQTAIEDAVPQCDAFCKSCVADALDRATPDEWAKIAEILKVALPSTGDTLPGPSPAVLASPGVA